MIMVQCTKKEINENNLILSQFEIHLTIDDLKSERFSEKYMVSDYDFKLVWSIKEVSGCKSLILESCNTKNIFIKIVTYCRSNRESKYSAWEKLDKDDKKLFPDDLLELPKIITEVTFDYADEVENEMKIEFRIYSQNKLLLKTLKDMTKNYDTLMKSKQFSDVEIIVRDEKFDAHKLILSTRSSVFAAMANSGALQNGTIEIKNIEPKTFKFLLNFIYTGRIANDENSGDVDWFQLLLAADKYAMLTLKRICARNLSLSLSVDNVIDIFIFSDKASEIKLKLASVDYIVANKSKVAVTEKFQEMTRSHPNLAIELFRKLMLY